MDKGYGIKGFEAKIEICKSRRSPAGRFITMIFDQVNGFRNDLSMLEYIKSTAGLGGNGMAYYLKDVESVTKFKLSNFAEKYKENEEFRKQIHEVCERELINSIKISDNINSESENLLDNEIKEKNESSETQDTEANLNE